MNTPDQFNAAYLAAQPLNVQLILKSTDPNSSARLAALAGQPSIDPQIILAGRDAYWTMWARQMYGYTWVPALGQPPIQVVPGQFLEGYPSYDPNNPPAGSIIVVDPANCDLATTYPPVIPPPLPVDATVNPVGAPMFTASGLGTPGTYYANFAAIFHNGQPVYTEGAEVNDNGTILFYHQGFDAMGQITPMWETAAAKAARVAKGQ